MKIKWLGQGGYLLCDENVSICIDPYLSDSVNRILGVPRIAEIPIEPEDLDCGLVICTHDHLDHLDPDTISRMVKENKTFLAPSACENHLKELGASNYMPFDEGKTYKIGEFKLSAVFADHTVSAIGVIVSYKELKLYFSGDTYYNEKILALRGSDIDVFFVCINGRLGNMNVEEAVKLTKELGAKVGIPNHYGMFASNTEDPGKYLSGVENSLEMQLNMLYDINDIIRKG